MEKHIEEIIQKIYGLLKINSNLFVFKTEDVIFDSFIIELIKTKIDRTSKNKIKIININQIANDEIELHELLEIKEFNFNIFFIPKSDLYKFNELDYLQKKISNSIFLVDYYEILIKSLIKNILIKNTNNSIIVSNQESEVTSLLDHLNSGSVSKKLLYLGLFLQTIDQNPNIKIEEFSATFPFGEFLNNLGEDFIIIATKFISLDWIERIFKTFFQISETKINFNFRTQEQLISLTNVNPIQLSRLLELASSFKFQLLTKVDDEKYTINTTEYAQEWNDFKTWINEEKEAYRQFKILESFSNDYFNNQGILLSKEQISLATSWKEKFLNDHRWISMYNANKELLNSYILLSQNFLEESLQKEQKKRAAILKNTVRISISIGIAFILSSFTALIAFLERNSAIMQQELAEKAKYEAEQAKENAEEERIQAVLARKNESEALVKAEQERKVALEAKFIAEQERRNAYQALDRAKEAEQIASTARQIAENNEIIANEAKETALFNFKISEQLRNQEKARASALEALGHFLNGNDSVGKLLAEEAYLKNWENNGFALQPDILNSIWTSILSLNKEDLSLNLDFPSKFISVSPSRKYLAVYTIDGDIHIFYSSPELKWIKTIKIGYIKSMKFISNKEVGFIDLEGNFYNYHIDGNSKELLGSGINKIFQNLSSTDFSWVVSVPRINNFQFNSSSRTIPILKEESDEINAIYNENDSTFIAEGKNLIVVDSSRNIRSKLFSAPQPISTIAKSSILNSLVIGLVNGQIIFIELGSDNIQVESYTIHASSISSIGIFPYYHNTELMLSTGYDGKIYAYIITDSNSISTSISSRISLNGHKSWVTGMEIDPITKTVYTISEDRTIRIWPLNLDEFIKRTNQITSF